MTDDPNLEIKIISAMGRELRMSYGEVSRRIDSGELRMWTVRRWRKYCRRIEKEREKYGN